MVGVKFADNNQKWTTVVFRLWKKTRGGLLFLFAVLSGLGGGACVLQWFEIKPKDVGSFLMSSAAHLVWLVAGIALLGCSIAFYTAFLKLRYARPEMTPEPDRHPIKQPEPKLKIHSAFWGTDHTDDCSVIDQIKQYATDGLVLKVGRETLGDPAPGKTKRLRIKYSYGNDHVEEVVRPEYSRLILPVDTSPSGQDEIQGELSGHSDDVDQSFRSDADQFGAKRRRALSV